MTRKTCDKCGCVIEDNDKAKGSVYQFRLGRDSIMGYANEDYLELKKFDLCYNCALDIKKRIEGYIA